MAELAGKLPMNWGGSRSRLADGRSSFEKAADDAARGRNNVWNGGRGFGFTGGHFHDNWGNEEFRKTVLNALVWVAKAKVPEAGVQSSVTPADLDANLDPKPPKR